MSHNAHVLELLPAYALGSLDPEEASRVEQHLLSCLICREESEALGSVADQLSLAAPLASAPDLKERLMERIRVTPPQPAVPVQRPKRPWMERLLPIWGLASLGLVLVLAGLNLFLWQRLGQARLMISAAGMRAVPLYSTGFASTATGFVLISED